MRHLRAMPEGIMVIWEWEWLSESSQLDIDSDGDGGDTDETCESAGTETESGTESDQESNDTQTEDTVTFKCIGASREVHSQDALASAKQKLDRGESVPVRIEPEPSNPFDSDAISFQCKLDDTWVTIGYVVKEILPHVHRAIQSHSIVSVDFKWIKYIVMWTRSGPGYYAGINVTCRGKWPPQVRQFSSTR